MIPYQQLIPGLSVYDDGGGQEESAASGFF